MLIKNASWLFFAEVISKIFAYGVVVLLSRSFGPEKLGQYSFIFYYVGLLSIFSDFGVEFYIMREVARDRKRLNKLFPDVLGFKIVLAFINFLIIVGSVIFLPKPWSIKIFIILAGAEAILTSISNLFVRIMYALNVTKYDAIARIFERLWAFFIGGFIIYYFRSFSGFILTLIIGHTLRDILRIRWGRNFIKDSKICLNLKKWKSLLKYSYPFWFIGIFTMIYYKTDMVMLNLLKGDYETGIYRAAYTLIEIPMFVPTIIVSTTLPSMARLWKKDKKALNILFKKSFQILITIGIIVTLGYHIFADFGIFFIFGKSYELSVPVLKVLAFALPFMFLNSLLGSYMNATGKELVFTKITGLTAFLNIIINYFFILYYGAEGAAVATVISQMMASLLSLLFFIFKTHIT